MAHSSITPVSTPLTIKTAIEEIDPLTGFITFENHPFTAKAKAQFLLIFEKTGDEALSMRSVGNRFNKKLLAAHKSYDKAFGEAFSDVVGSMVNKLEGTMFTRGLDPKGTLDRFGWLRAHAPEKYAPKPNKVEEDSEKKKLEELYAKAIDATFVYETTPTVKKETVKEITNGNTTDTNTTTATTVGQEASNTGTV